MLDLPDAGWGCTPEVAGSNSRCLHELSSAWTVEKGQPITEQKTAHLSVLIADERQDRLELLAHLVAVLGHEVGFRPLDRHEANLFFRLVSARYEKGSIILTTNKHVQDWPEIFAGDEILTTAILDRLLHHVHIVHIDGRSYRLREIGELLQGATVGSPPPQQKGGKTPAIAGAGA